MWSGPRSGSGGRAGAAHPPACRSAQTTTGKTRARRTNTKRQIVKEREYLNLKPYSIDMAA